MSIPRSIFLFLLFFNVAFAQKQFSIQGSLPQAPKKEILLKGFTIQGDSLLTKTTTDAQGKFILQYPARYVGAALLEIKNTKSVIVLLNHENFEIQWDNLEEFSILKFIHSPENTALSKGLELYGNTESKRSALAFLIPLYEQEKVKQQIFKNELAVQNKAFAKFMAALPQESYALYYIKLRKLLSDMPQTASKYIERMPEHEKDFNNLDFSGDKFVHSGLYKDLFEGYIQLMESSGEMLYPHLNASIDAVVKSLKGKPELLQELSQNLFNLLEKRSLFKSAEHLALAILDDSSCQLDEKHQALFEQYHKMGIGKTAPDIVFLEAVEGIRKLSDIKSKYKLVVFGASWCSKCTEELPKLLPYYENWKNKDGVEIVFVSLDQDKAAFANFSKDFPWISSCDYKFWEGQAVRDYCVFATPTMYLLDSNQKILAKPVSPDHLGALLEMYRGDKKE